MTTFKFFLCFLTLLSSGSLLGGILTYMLAYQPHLRDYEAQVLTTCHTANFSVVMMANGVGDVTMDSPAGCPPWKAVTLFKCRASSFSVQLGCINDKTDQFNNPLGWDCWYYPTVTCPEKPIAENKKPTDELALSIIFITLGNVGFIFTLVSICCYRWKQSEWQRNHTGCREIA
jgi:hypothetical protein